MIYSPNKYSDRQTDFTLLHDNESAMVPKWKEYLYNNNNKKNIYTYILIRVFVQKLPIIEQIACTKIPEFFFLNSCNFFKNSRSIFEKITSITS